MSRKSTTTAVVTPTPAVAIQATANAAHAAANAAHVAAVHADHAAHVADHAAHPAIHHATTIISKTNKAAYHEIDNAKTNKATMLAIKGLKAGDIIRKDTTFYVAFLKDDDTLQIKLFKKTPINIKTYQSMENVHEFYSNIPSGIIESVDVPTLIPALTDMFAEDIEEFNRYNVAYYPDTKEYGVRVIRGRTEIKFSLAELTRDEFLNAFPVKDAAAAVKKPRAARKPKDLPPLKETETESVDIDIDVDVDVDVVVPVSKIPAKKTAAKLAVAETPAAIPATKVKAIKLPLPKASPDASPPVTKPIKAIIPTPTPTPTPVQTNEDKDEDEDKDKDVNVVTKTLKVTNITNTNKMPQTDKPSVRADIMRQKGKKSINIVHSDDDDDDDDEDEDN
jgi:hypothetical protein